MLTFSEDTCVSLLLFEVMDNVFCNVRCTKVYNLKSLLYIYVIDVEHQKRALFGHIASNYKQYGITWAEIADALEDFAGNLAIEIREKFCSEPNGTLNDPTHYVYNLSKLCLLLFYI